METADEHDPGSVFEPLGSKPEDYIVAPIMTTKKYVLSCLIFYKICIFFEKIIGGQGSKLRKLVRTTLTTQIIAASTPTRPRLSFPKHTAAKRFILKYDCFKI